MRTRPGGFALTEEGAQVFEATTRLLASVDDFPIEVNEINEVNNRLVGRLSIALFDMTLTNPNARLDAAFQAFDQVAPDVNLRLRVLGTDDSERGALNGEVHVGIVPAQRRSITFEEPFSAHEGTVNRLLPTRFIESKPQH